MSMKKMSTFYTSGNTYMITIQKSLSKIKMNHNFSIDIYLSLIQSVFRQGYHCCTTNNQ